MEKFQRENPYNCFLPYAAEVKDDADRNFEQIKINLKSCLKPNLDLTEISIWIGNLKEYLKLYGFRFSAEDHVWMVKLFCGLLLSDHIDHMYLEKFGQILVTLTGKEYLLHDNDLIIDWRPLYNLYYKFEDSKQFTYGLLRVQSELKSTLRMVIFNLTPFFAKNATQEMLDEWRPLLCPSLHDTVSMQRGEINFFVPTSLITMHSWYRRYINSYPNSCSLG